MKKLIINRKTLHALAAMYVGDDIKPERECAFGRFFTGAVSEYKLDWGGGCKIDGFIGVVFDAPKMTLTTKAIRKDEASRYVTKAECRRVTRKELAAAGMLRETGTGRVKKASAPLLRQRG